MNRLCTMNCKAGSQSVPIKKVTSKCTKAWAEIAQWLCESQLSPLTSTLHVCYDEPVVHPSHPTAHSSSAQPGPAQHTRGQQLPGQPMATLGAGNGTWGQHWRWAEMRTADSHTQPVTDLSTVLCSHRHTECK